LATYSQYINVGALILDQLWSSLYHIAYII
jgi:hypothetical protein